MQDRHDPEQGNPQHQLKYWPMDSEDIDRRILHSESRIKSWVIGGVLAHLLILASGAIPVIYTLGKMSEKADQVIKNSDNTSQQMMMMGRWMQNREVWGQSLEAWAETQGYKPPRGVSGRLNDQ